MDREIIEQVRRANDACMLLLTHIVNDDEEAAMKEVLTNPVYRDPGTTMAIATIATSAIKTLADMSDVDPKTVLQIAALNAAQLAVILENGGELP